QPDGRVDGQVTGEVEVADELVEEQAAQALVGTGVAREQRALHDLGQVREREHRSVEVREVRPECGFFFGGERLRRVQHGEPMVPVALADQRGCWEDSFAQTRSRYAPGATRTTRRDTGARRTPSTSRGTAAAASISRLPPERWRIRGWGTCPPVRS